MWVRWSRWRREAARLEELRLAAVEGRIEADIELGLHAEVIGELEGLVGEYPLRERLWRLLVLALYRAERQADALAAYRRARDLLAPSWAWSRARSCAGWNRRCCGRRSPRRRRSRGITCPRR